MYTYASQSRVHMKGTRGPPSLGTLTPHPSPTSPFPGPPTRVPFPPPTVRSLTTRGMGLRQPPMRLALAMWFLFNFMITFRFATLRVWQSPSLVTCCPPHNHTFNTHKVEVEVCLRYKGRWMVFLFLQYIFSIPPVTPILVPLLMLYIYFRFIQVLRY